MIAEHGYCIATCKVCKRPVLYSKTLIPKTQYNNGTTYDPMTSVKNHYRAIHPELFETLFMNMKIPIPDIHILVNFRSRKHIVQEHGGFNQECWCLQTHRVVRTLRTHSHRKESKVTILEDIENP